MTDESPRPPRWKIGAVAGGAIAVCAALYVLAARTNQAPAEAAPPAWGDEDPPTLAGAISKAGQWQGHDVDATTARSLVLLGWANRHLKWSEVEVKSNETSYELIQQGIDAQLGKRMCVSGTVDRVNLVKTDSARSSSGVLVTGDAKPFVFMAARNSGSITEKGAARLCGIVTGWNATASDLGAPRAVVLVGMFEADRDQP